MKKVRVDFCGFWDSFDKNNNLFIKILKKYFEVEVCDKPDFVICSNRGKPFEYMKYDCVRIMFMGENMSPDFTVFDYVIGFDYLTFRDRYFRMPFVFYNDDAQPWIPEQLTEEQAWKILKRKKFFCNFIYGHESSHGMREELFRRLSCYKDVVSPGSYLNNTAVEGKSKKCTWQEKYQYLLESKFTIAGDSIVYPGFVTEKIVQPFEKHSIPVYFGNPEIDKDFNPEAFVWCRDKSDIERVVDQVKFLDENDDAYIDMLLKCPLTDKKSVETLYCELEKFLFNIFNQERKNAFRRIRYFCANNHEKYLREYGRRYEKTPKVIHKLKSKINIE